MREITIDGKAVRVRANPLALLYYKQEFKSDLLGDLLKMQDLQSDPSSLDSVSLLQITWAMAKAAEPKGFPPFEQWLTGIESFDFTDDSLIVAVVEEATDGFFRGGAGGGKQRPRR